MSGPGYGRGGRGAALLQALNAPVRRPGAVTPAEQPSPTPPVQPPITQPVQPPITQPAPRLGRGFALLQQAPATVAPQSPVAPTQQQQVSPPTQHIYSPTQYVQPPTPAAQPLASGGRGLAAFGRARALQDLLKQPSGGGAGRGALIAAAISPPSSGLASPAARTSPLSTGSSPHRQQTPSPVASVPSASPPQQSAAQASPPAAQMEDDGERRLTRLEYMMQRISIEEPAVVKCGRMGQRVPLVANYIPVKCLNEGQFQYAVSFDPEVHSRNMRFKLVYSQTEVIGQTRNFDGSILFLPIRLPQEETVIETVRPTDEEPVKIKIKLAKVLPPEQCIQLYNVLFRNIMKMLKYVQVNRHDYDPHRPAKIPQHRLEVWPGYVTALSRYQGGLMLMADVSHKVLRTETAYEVIRDISTKQGGKGLQDEVLKALIGSVVMTRYNNKTYRVDDIQWEMNPLSTFDLANGEKMSFAEYYRKHYNKEIRDPKQPLLVHRPKKRDQQQSRRRELEIILLVPELCYMTGLSDAMRADFRVMKDLATHTRVSPAARQLAMRQYCENVNSHPEARQELAKWGLELDMDILRLPGRKLQEEIIVLGKNKTVPAGPRADWSRAATGREAMLSTVALKQWMVLCTERNAATTIDAVQMLIRCAQEMGMFMGEPQVFKLSSDRTEEYVRTIREHHNEQLQMIMMIMPTSRDDRYNSVKKLCCCEKPVASQVINFRTISKKDKLRSVCQKVVLQLNCKLGGTLWGLKIPNEINSQSAGGLMVVGIDVYHDKSHGQSCAAIVCSTDVRITRYYSEVVFQAKGTEIISKLKLAFMNGIKQYHRVNHRMPMNVVVFRDGVGDGMMNVVANTEVPQFMSAFTHFGEDYKPKMAVVVVQKRINTRMFLQRGEGRNASLENPAPGTILDHTVTRRNYYDFFLVSQHVTQGTVSPSHYVVVKDFEEWPADLLQKVTYQMCHLYYNWPGTIRVPAPCQYAHKLAQLAGLNLHKVPHKDLNDRLFYL